VTPIIILGVGFSIAWLGVIMVFLSLKTEPAELQRRGLGFLVGPFAKSMESRRLIKFVIILGITITTVLYIAAWMGLIAW
jgi:hypothetical protein